MGPHIHGKLTMFTYSALLDCALSPAGSQVYKSQRMKLVSAVTTAPRFELVPVSTGKFKRRAPVDYLTGTLESLHTAGFEPIVVNDPEFEGSWPTLRKALGTLLENDEAAEALCVWQDDIRVAAGLSGWLDANLWPCEPAEIGVVSLYTAAVNLQSEDGWFRLSDLAIHRPFGACGYCFPRWAAQRLIDNPTNVAFSMGSDTSVASFCIREGLDYWMRSPGFCQHVGSISSIGNTRGLDPQRSAGRWIVDCATMAVDES